MESDFNKYFSYNTVDDSTKEKFSVINDAVQRCALTLMSVVENKAERTLILRRLQELRMLTNCAVTHDYTGITLRDLVND